MTSSTSLPNKRATRPNALHLLIRELTAAVLDLDATEIVDPRGLILDVTPRGDWVARVRTGSRQWAFGPTEEEWAPGRPTSWTWLDPAEDEALPGRALMSDADALSRVTGLEDPHTDVVRYRMGRRATVRVVGYVGDERRVRYVKLLRTKKMKRALRTYGLLSEIAGDLVLAPHNAVPELCVLVFDEVEGRSLHEMLWTADSTSLQALAAQVDQLCDRLNRIRVPDDSEALPQRGIENERQSALDMLRVGSRVRPELARLIRVVTSLDLPSTPDDESGLIHADLHDKQVFETPDGFKLIDCEGSARGPAVLDRSNLIEHVRLRGFQGARFGHEIAARLRRVLGVQRNDPHARVLTALTRARLAGVYALRPWWWWLSRDLEAEALSLLCADEASQDEVLP